MCSASFILLVEDDVDDQDMLIEALFLLDPTVRIETVSDGDHALRFLSDCSPAELPTLLLLDYNTPVLDGAGLLARISYHPRYQFIPKLVWSSSRQPEHIEKCMDRGATCYFMKPNSTAELQRIAKKVLILFKQQSAMRVQAE